MGTFSSDLSDWLNKYRFHLLVFLVVFFAGLTFAHPGLLLSDEWVTVNQLDQIHAGHQVIVNEGKYGTFENGTVSQYFIAKKNYLGYSLFLPLISLPAYWLLDLFGEHFVFFILYLWTLMLIAIALLLNGFFKKYTYAGRWQWTTGLFIAAFVLLFVNFRYYIPFFVTGNESYPEILAIVFTNIFLFALFSVFIVEINRMIFTDSFFSSFGSIICISCSSYLFWTTNCKDHILTACIFILVMLMLVKYQKSGSFWYLSSAFISSGLLAWARPELALMVFGALCIYIVYAVFIREGRFAMDTKGIHLLVSPLFTLIGAIPFFINNYMITGNALLVPFTLWDKEPSTNLAASSTSLQGASTTFQPLFHIISASTNFQSSTFLYDLSGVFLNPQSGSLGVFVLTPIFLVAVLLIPILIVKKEFRFSNEEKQFSGIMGLLALAVFFTYVRGISGMNASPGIVPDIRYLSPIYVPLNIMGLIVIRKLTIIGGNEIKILWDMVAIWILFIPMSIVIILKWYPAPEIWSAPFFDLLNGYSTVLMLILLVFLVISVIGYEFYQTPASVPVLLLAIFCAIPFIWQIDATFVLRAFGSGLGGYSFWIPAVRMFFVGMFG
jgi:hypothetical protein